MNTALENIVEELQLDKSKWKLTKFGNVALQQKGKVDRENTKLTRYIQGGHMNSEDLHIRNWGNLKDEYLGPAFIRKFEKGDILYGSRRTYLRKVAIADFEGITSNTTFVIKANEENIDKRLLPFIMMSEGFTENSIKNSKGSVNPYINWKDIAKYEFLLPPKDQQAKLAELLWAMDEVVERENEVLESVKQTYLVKIERELINRKCRKVHFEDLGEVIRGVGYKPKDLLETYSNDNCIILRSNNIFESKINYDDIKILDLDGVKPKQILEHGDFAICMSNGSKDLVGKSAIYFDEGKNVSIGSFCAGFRPKDNLSQRISQHLFSSESYRYAIKRILTGSAINNLKPSDIESLFLRIEENTSKVEVILKELDTLVLNIGVLQSKISSSKALQKSLINQMF